VRREYLAEVSGLAHVLTKPTNKMIVMFSARTLRTVGPAATPAARPVWWRSRERDVNGQLTPPLELADHVQGRPGAPLELVMFSDFQCPYCRTAQEVVRGVRERLGERLLFAFRHCPITDKHRFAQAAAEASEAAAAQGHFWEYHDALYVAQSRLSNQELLVIADRLGLDAERVAQELANGRWRERVARDVRSAIASGVPGTPTFFVNGRRHDDAYDADVLVAALEADPPTSSGNPSAGREARTLSRQA
jgi:protein-disulfide isomerase